mgnify:CR=1 FL=1
MTRDKLRLIEMGILVLTEGFCLCDIKGYRIKTVITTEKYWNDWESTIMGNLDLRYDLILIDLDH